MIKSRQPNPARRRAGRCPGDVEGVRAVVGFERLEPSDSRPDQLSNRELEVLSYLPTMLTASEIATQLYVSVNTIEAHVKSIYLKLGVPAAGRRRPGIRRWHPLARPFVPPGGRRGELGAVD